MQDVAQRESRELAAIFQRIAWRIIPFLCVCYVFSFLDRINVGFAKLQMLDELKLSEAVYGLGAAVFFVGYILFEVPSNLILEKVGARAWFARIMVTWGILSAMHALVSTATHFYVLRFLLGAAEAGFLPGILYYLTRWFPSYRRGRFVALLALSIPLASVIGGPLSGWIMSNFNGTYGWAGWRWLFVLEGIPTVLLGLVTLALLPERPRDARWLTEHEKSNLQAVLDADTREITTSGHRFIEGILNLKVWMLGAIDFGILLTLYALGFWLPTFIRNAGATGTVEIGFLTAIPSVCGLAAMWLISRSSDRRRERRWHIIVPFLIAATAIAASPHVAGGSVPITVIIFSIAGAMIYGAIPVFFTLPGTFLQGPAAAAGFALAISLANIAGVVSNSVMGFAMDLTGSSASALYLFAAYLVIACVIAFLLPAKQVNR
jgi:sugar phosphate permease